MLAPTPVEELNPPPGPGVGQQNSAFVLAGALRLTTAAEQLGLDTGLSLLFFAVAAVRIAFGILLGIETRRLTSTSGIVLLELTSVVARCGSVPKEARVGCCRSRDCRVAGPGRHHLGGRAHRLTRHAAAPSVGDEGW
ncbi:MAG TPA: hypothetical protein VFX16_26325 [Pseudonocardiaceae bacterium]|nr:hypothetical protein [Pseudonocardiaceae bacterium]